MTIKYRGFVGNLEIDLDTKLLVGKVQNIRAALLYQGATVDEAVADFHAAIDDYLADCEKRGIQPEQSYTGTFQVRVPPELHFKLVTHAAENNLTLNAVVVNALTSQLQERKTRTMTARLDLSLLPDVKMRASSFSTREMVTAGGLEGKFDPSTFSTNARWLSLVSSNVPEPAVSNTWDDQMLARFSPSKDQKCQPN